MCQCASVWLCSAKPESRSETRGPGTCFPQGHPRHSRCFQVFRLQRERNFSEACVRAPPLLALSPCPLQSPARLCHRLGPGLHSLAFSLHPRTLGGTGRATAACPQELVRLGPALPAGPEGPRSRQCGDPSRWAPFTSSAGGGAGEGHVLALHAQAGRAQDLPPQVQLQLRSFQKGGEGPILSAVHPLCVTPTPEMIVFGSVTHSF